MQNIMIISYILMFFLSFDVIFAVFLLQILSKITHIHRNFSILNIRIAERQIFYTALLQELTTQICWTFSICLYTLYRSKYYLWPVCFFLFLSHCLSSVIGFQTQTLPSYWSNKVCLQSTDKEFLFAMLCLRDQTIAHQHCLICRL